MAPSSNPEEAHIFPPSTGGSRQVILCGSPSCSTQGVGDPPQGTSKSSSAGTPRGTTRRSQVSCTVSHIVNIGITTPRVLELPWCNLGCFPPFFLLGVRKESTLPFRKDGKPLSKALLSSERGKFPQPLDQAWLLWGWEWLPGTASGLSTCASGTANAFPPRPQGILAGNCTGQSEDWV